MRRSGRVWKEEDKEEEEAVVGEDMRAGMEVRVCSRSGEEEEGWR